MRAAADAADRFAAGELRTTNMQNLLVVNVPNNNVAALANAFDAVGLPVGGSPFWRGVVACSGTEFCKIAITETKSFSRWLVEELEERLPGFEQHLKLHVTGCPNSCGQHWIADIGLEGKKIKVDGRQQDAYYFCVGGAVGLHQSVARPIGYRCLASEVPDAIERLMRRYLDERLPDENLRRFFARHSDDELRECLAGKFLRQLSGIRRRGRCRMRLRVRETVSNVPVILSGVTASRARQSRSRRTPACPADVSRLGILRLRPSIRKRMDGLRSG